MATNNEMKTMTLDYRAFLADLEAKKAALDQAIVSVEPPPRGGSGTGLAGSYGRFQSIPVGMKRK